MAASRVRRGAVQGCVLALLCALAIAFTAFRGSPQSIPAAEEPNSVGPVANLVASTASMDVGSVRLTWTAAENAQVHFVVHIKTADLAARSFSEVRMVPFSGSEGVVTGLESGTSYSFIVIGMRWNWINYGAVWGSWSDWIYATPEGRSSSAGHPQPALPAPEPSSVGPVANLVASTASMDVGSVRLTWTAAENAQVHFVVHIKTADLAARSFSEVRMVPSFGSEGVVTGLESGTSYSFIVIGMRWNWINYGAVWGSWSTWTSTAPGNGAMVSPSAAFGTLVISKRFDAETFYVDFDQGDRFVESGRYPGSYTYMQTGPDTSTLILSYDGAIYGGRCTISLVFESRTTGTWSYACASGIRGQGNWSVAERGIEFIEGEAATRFIPENITADINVGLPIFATGNPSVYVMSGADAKHFMIIPDTGQIRTKAGVIYDYETRSRYSVTVGAADDYGHSDTIQVAIRLQDVASGCEPLRNLRTNHSGGRLTVRWTSVPDTVGNAAVLGYQTEIRSGDQGPWSDRRMYLGRNVGAMIYDGLSDGTAYQVRVRPVNLESECQWSPPVGGMPTDALTPRYPTDRFGTRLVGVPERNWRFLTQERCRYTGNGVTSDASCQYENTGLNTGRLSMEFDDPSSGSCEIAVTYSSLTTGVFADACSGDGLSIDTEFDIGFGMPVLAPGSDQRSPPSPAVSERRPTPEPREGPVVGLIGVKLASAVEIRYKTSLSANEAHESVNSLPSTLPQVAPRNQEEFDALVYGRDDFIPGLCFGSCGLGKPSPKGNAKRYSFADGDGLREHPGKYGYESTGATQGVLTYSEATGEVWRFEIDFERSGAMNVVVTDDKGTIKDWSGVSYLHVPSGGQSMVIPIPLAIQQIAFDVDLQVPRSLSDLAELARASNGDLAHVGGGDIIKLLVKDHLAGLFGDLDLFGINLGDKLAEWLVGGSLVPVNIKYVPISDGRMELQVQFGDYGNVYLPNVWDVIGAASYSAYKAFVKSHFGVDVLSWFEHLATVVGWVFGTNGSEGALEDFGDTGLDMLRGYIWRLLSGTTVTMSCSQTSQQTAYVCTTRMDKEGEPPHEQTSLLDLSDGSIVGNYLPDELFLPDTPPQAPAQDQPGLQVAAAVSVQTIGGSDVQAFLVSSPSGDMSSYRPGDWLEPKDGSYQRMMVVGASQVSAATSLQDDLEDLMPTVSRGGMVSAIPASWGLDPSSNSCVPRSMSQSSNVLTRLDVVCMQFDRAIPARGARYFSQPKAPQGPVQTCQRNCVLNASQNVQECVWKCEGSAPAAGPDLVVETVSVSDQNPALGQTFQLMARTVNLGTGPSVATTLHYYLSDDRLISSNDTQVGIDSIEPLTVSGLRSAWRSRTAVTAPDVAGTYYYGACVVAVSEETDTTNNCSVTVAVTVGGAPGADQGTGSCGRFSDLRSAITSGDPEAVRCVIEQLGTNVDAKDDHGNPMLFWAILEDDPEILRILVDAGADVDATDDDGNPMLFWAILDRDNPVDILRILVDAGADVDAEDDHGNPILYWAILDRDNPVEIVRILVDGHADVNATTARGRSMLFWARLQENAEVIRILIAAGAVE